MVTAFSSSGARCPHPAPHPGPSTVLPMAARVTAKILTWGTTRVVWQRVCVTSLGLPALETPKFSPRHNPSSSPSQGGF